MAQNESFYLDLIENLSDGVYFTDLNRRVLYWNTSAERITGFRKKEVIGNRCMDNILRHVDAAGNLLCLQGCPLEAVTMDGQVHEAEVFLHHKEGHRVPVRVRASPIRDGEGSIIGAAEIFNDNSSKLQVEERLAEMERLALADTLESLIARADEKLYQAKQSGRNRVCI